MRRRLGIPIVLVESMMDKYRLKPFGLLFFLIGSSWMWRHNLGYVILIELVLYLLLFFKAFSSIHTPVHVTLLLVGIGSIASKEEDNLVRAILLIHLFEILYVVVLLIFYLIWFLGGPKERHQLEFVAALASLEVFHRNNSLSLDDVENHFQSHQLDLEKAYVNKIETMAGDDEIALVTVNDDTSQTFLLGGMLADEITMKPFPWIKDGMENNPFYSDTVELVIRQVSEPFQIVRCRVPFRTFCFLSGLLRMIDGANPVFHQYGLFLNSPHELPSPAQVSYYLINTLTPETIEHCHQCKKHGSSLRLW
jgi:hypothetical protein